MCYDSDATPPVFGAPITATTDEPLALTSTDGTKFAAHFAQPESPAATGILVLPDNRGLSQFYEQLTVRLAEQGFPALAIDYFARTAGFDHHDRPDFADLETLLPHLMKLNADTLFADIETGIAQLRERSGCTSVVSLGFCMGGRFAFQTAATRFGLAGVIGLYGAPDILNGRPGPTQLAHTFTAPVLGLFGGADPGIPPEAVQAFEAALAAAGVPHEIVTYEGAPHGFFELQQAEHAAASAAAWQRILAFVAPGKI